MGIVAFVNKKPPSQDEQIAEIMNNISLECAFMFGEHGLLALQDAVEALRLNGRYDSASKIERHIVVIHEELLKARQR